MRTAALFLKIAFIDQKPLLLSALSTTSSWTKVAVCKSSTRTAPLYVLSFTLPATLAESSTNKGRIFFPFCLRIYFAIRSTHPTLEVMDFRNNSLKVSNSFLMGRLISDNSLLIKFSLQIVSKLIYLFHKVITKGQPG